ncbi:hypothetical protein ACLSYX_08500 [[Pasteurella] aerogenes]|uniref:Uncharacterized protein n=1 Tax=[Pasteurella] mairii TaxID=757 RepID=A0A379B5G1_9PAST|nr:hypothetical protein [[Pasteurella] mairii]SUB28741.1 Uncharacterised protein [[Pasteurella] mairii]SUB33290.1 Uncharacterised protein [[Pasteurella] mairii]
MYYLNKEIEIRLDFLTTEKRYWHCITKITTDYVNKEVIFEISSYLTEEDFNKNTHSFVTVLTLDDAPKFSVDPILFAWRALVSNKNSPFFKAEIRNNYDIEFMNNVYRQETV